MRRLAIIFLVGLGCTPKPLPEQEIPPGPGVDGDGDADADADGGPPDDGLADADLDADDTGDRDGDADGGIDCEEVPTHDPLDECVTQELRCGSEPLLSSTKRGMYLYDREHYNAYDCFPFGDEYDGPERIFAFTHPGGDGGSIGRATVTLNAPCDELHLIALQWTGWEDSEQCPDESNEGGLGLRCYDKINDDDGVITLDLDESNEMPYLLIVDGPKGEEANFTIDISCPG